MFLADHQEALGHRAFKCVDDLNKKTVSKFNDVAGFRDSIAARKSQESFYQANTKVKPYIKSSFKKNMLSEGATPATCLTPGSQTK